MATPTYTAGQRVELHFIRMDNGTTWLLLQRDGTSSGQCYHVTPAHAERLPRQLTLHTEVFSSHPHACYVSLPKEGTTHHRHLTFTHQELASCDFAAASHNTENAEPSAQQLTFDF